MDGQMSFGQHGHPHAPGALLTGFDAEVGDACLAPESYSGGGVGKSPVSFAVFAVLSPRNTLGLGWRGIVKRACDIVVATSLLVLLAPCFGAIALAIRLTSRGPALFYQTRVGLGGRTFRLVKFRTMVADAEKDTGPVWARDRDPRCTRLGAFLRRTSLDELPQLWNVLRGEMSLVGPRPERPVFVERFSRQYPGYILRHRVKGGLTGWAQVNGWRGNTPISARLDHDLLYIRNWSFSFDLWVLWRTLRGGFVNRNAY